MQRPFRVGGQGYNLDMKEYNSTIVEYINEQLPDIINSYEDATLMGEPDYAEYLSGVIQAYEHITEKFGA
jgi:hypothetical protein